MDRNLYKSDKKLASRGWHAMREALDREMPEERRRRPVALLWIFALLVPAAGALGWLIFRQGTGAPSELADVKPIVVPPSTGAAILDKQMAEIPEKNARPTVPAANNDMPAGRLRYNATKKTERHLLSSAYQTVSPHFNGTTDRETAPSTTGQVSLQPAGANPTFEPLGAGNALKTPESTNSVTETTLQDIETASHPETVQTGEPGEMPAQNTIAGVFAPAAAADTTAVTSFVMPPKPIDPLRDNKKSTWAFGANAGVMSDSKGDYAGAGAGLSAEWQPLKKWGLRSGIGYQFHQLATDERPVVSLSAISYVDVTGDQRVALDNNNFHSPGTAQGSTDPSPVFIPVGRLHRVEMPVLAFWQPISKLRVFGGVAIGNNLYVETGDRTLSNNKVYTVLDGDAGKKLNNEVSEQFREWDTRWSIGVGFKPVRHLELGLFFHKPLPSGRFGAIDQDLKLDNAQVNFQEAISGKSSGLTTNGLFNFTASWFF